MDQIKITPSNSMEKGNGSEKGAAVAISTDEHGYKVELPREMSVWSAIGLGLAIMACPYGLSTTISIALQNGGPVSVLWGWVFISLMSICIALSLAEICSRFPTSGGPYYWSYMLASSRYNKPSSYVVGWLGLIGNWTVSLSIIYGTAQLIIAIPPLWHPEYQAESYQTYLLFLAVLLICFSANFLKQKHLDALNTFSIYWTGGTVVVVLITVLSMARNGRTSGAFAFGGFQVNSGWVPGWAWCVGLLQSAYVLTGYGMVAAMADEVAHPERDVPRGMVGSVIAAAVVGLLYLIPLLFVMTDLEILLDAAQPVPILFQQATGTSGATGLMVLIITIGLLGGIGALTTSSRCCYSFARDNGMMGSKWWKVIWREYLPLNALILSSIVIGLLGLISFESAAFSAFTGVATITLGSSYAGPILISLLRKREPLEGAAFRMPSWLGFIVNIVCCCWILLSIVIFCMPTALSGLNADTMNYASVVFVGFASISFVYYIIYARKTFDGPPAASHSSEEKNSFESM
ncbi:hypothetical protein E3P92_01816 [Wallemia ichthyophaga]|uniref:Choline transport protein n=2 Tax=Wallemia ichthyophaga TaxID=245174 RepID=A0A4T0HUK7_WALIC|nr:hypothetical protein E3P98_00475 [Wallemia ichthyophaga]TIA90369.1 hypothetical protein E3P97_02584 [Wallemia ichthyophaga]TIA96761.1 hypothetical protein E3P96_03537 [Wallemia ichthyophaga]TIB01189.1 hypothetical protein E3P95_01373 [Wallemia ichthyophaga]TIB02152.1 hypothetical protein E3P94_01505 [Wallemia ichthyophaga]